MVVVLESFWKKMLKNCIHIKNVIQTKNFESKPVNSTMHTATKICFATLTYTDNYHTNAGGKRERHMKNLIIY